jgi:protein-tyrosine phosphatase
MHDMVVYGGPLYGRMMRRLLDIDAPLLYHCTAGKDRTGVSTALLMKVLGVKQESIIEDYLLVNKINPPEAWSAEMSKRMEAMVGQKIDPKLMAPVMGTRREWMETAMRVIDQKYGSFDAYRRDVLKISDADQKTLQNRLLE